MHRQDLEKASQVKTQANTTNQINNTSRNHRKTSKSVIYGHRITVDD